MKELFLECLPSKIGLILRIIPKNKQALEIYMLFTEGSKSQNFVWIPISAHLSLPPSVFISLASR